MTVDEIAEKVADMFVATKSYEAVVALLCDYEEQGVSTDDDNLAALRLAATEKLPQRYPTLDQPERRAIMQAIEHLI